MLRTTLLAVALAATGLMLAPVATAQPGPEVPTCQSTLDNPPSHFFCDAGVLRFECFRIEGGYRCELTVG